METIKRPGVTHITDPAIDSYRKLSSQERISALWRGYKSTPKNEDTFAAPFGLYPPCGRKTTDGNDVLPLYHATARKNPVNLLVVRSSDLHHRYLDELQPGQHTPCDDCSIDPEWIIAAESYLSGLALAHRWKEYPTVHVVSCFEPENIWPTLDSIYRKWPSASYVAAPDTRNKSLCHGIIYPPANLTWLDLHTWEVQGQWAA